MQISAKLNTHTHIDPEALALSPRVFSKDERWDMRGLCFPFFSLFGIPKEKWIIKLQFTITQNAIV